MKRKFEAFFLFCIFLSAFMLPAYIQIKLIPSIQLHGFLKLLITGLLTIFNVIYAYYVYYHFFIKEEEQKPRKKF